MWRSPAPLLLLLWLSLLPAALGQGAARPSGSCPGVLARAPAGVLCGRALNVAGHAVDVFLGVPYAESTAGANRFRPPVPEPHWSGVRQAATYGPMCPQNGNEIGNAPQSEDCLSLDVWTPAPAGGRAGPAVGGRNPAGVRNPAGGARGTAGALPSIASSSPRSRLPVMVFLPGGGFVHGGTAQRLYPGGPRLYDGARLAATQHMVVVTVNYRLGVLGFLAGAPGVPADLGLLDQQTALRWVRTNIAAFGGNPARVTLAGESAGAMSAGLQLLSMPSSAGLFHAVILESDPFGLPYRTVSQARLSADLFLLQTGCKLTTDTLACLQRLPLASLLKAQASSAQEIALQEQGLPAFLPWAPAVDGRLVVRQPLAAALGGRSNVPVLLGTNGSEATVFLAGGGPIGLLQYDALAKLMAGPQGAAGLAWRYPPSLFGSDAAQAISAASDGLFVCPTRAVARSAAAPAYLYSFTHRPSFNMWRDVPSCKDASCHGAELPFVFGTAGGSMAFTPAERRLSNAMMAAWGAFVRTGRPDPGPGGGLPAWPAYRAGGALMRLDTPPALAAAAPAHCGFWDARY